MRGKIFAIVIMLIAFFIGMQVSTSAQVKQYYYDDAWHEYYGNEFKLSINGRILQPQMPPIVFNDRSVVPARDVFEALGATVDWDAKTATVKVDFDGTLIKLKINSTIAHINAKSATMEIAPKIINERTMIPVRFVAEKLGFEVDFDSKNDTIKVNAKSTISEANSGQTITVAKSKITMVKHALDSEQKNLLINIITDQENPNFSDFVLSNPSRIVLDVTNSVFSSLPSEILISTGNVSKVRFGNNGNNARVVVDLTENLGYTVSSSGKAINLTVNVNPIKKDDPQKPFSVFTFESQGSRELFKTSLTISKVTENLAAKSLDITVTGDNLSEEKLELSIKSLFATKVTYEPDTTTEAMYRIWLGNNESTFTQTENQVSIKSKFKPVKRSVMLDAGHGGTDPGAVYKSEEGKLIAQEKDINLSVTLMVKEMLEKHDVEVHTIRTTDTYIDFQQVGSIANDIGATLFASIHTNSIDGVPNANGIEIYSYLEGGTVTNGMTGKQLAQNILDKMIEMTGATNRGVRNGQNLAVIRRTAAPAVLVEVGFISNEKERNLMLQKEYQQKLAEGIMQGILKSFEDMGI